MPHPIRSEGAEHRWLGVAILLVAAVLVGVWLSSYRATGTANAAAEQARQATLVHRACSDGLTVAQTLAAVLNEGDATALGSSVREAGPQVYEVEVAYRTARGGTRRVTWQYQAATGAVTSVSGDAEAILLRMQRACR